jgi:hypothetical protein
MLMGVRFTLRTAPRTVLLSLLLIVGSIELLSAQSAAPAEPTREQLLVQIEILRDQIKRLQAEVPAAPNLNDPELLQAAKDAQKKTYEYVSASVDSNISVLRGQQFASSVVLFLVVMIVVSGILFAGFQLWKSVAVAGVQDSSDLELSASKVRVTSSVVGVTILVISLAFLYIYTKEIYVIHVIDASPQRLIGRTGQ